MKKHVSLSALLSCVLLVGLSSLGCAHRRAEQAGTGTPTPQASAQPQLTKTDMKYKTIVLDTFTVSPSGIAETEPKSYVADAQSACAGQLTTSGLFESVKISLDSGPKEGTLIVQGEVTSLRIVGGAARFWVGAMAGNSDMTVHVKLVDAATGALVSENDVKDDTNAWAGGWTMGATDRSLPGRVGARIAEYVVFNAKK